MPLAFTMPLLPLHAVIITLRFTQNAYLPFFHQPALTAWLRHLSGNSPDYERKLWLDAPESGCVDYRRGDAYRFILFALPAGLELLQHLLSQLQTLPDSVQLRDKALPLRDNLQFISAVDLFSNKAITYCTELSGYDETALEAEASFWQYAPACRIRWLSPVRLLINKTEYEDGTKPKGEARFCRQQADLPFHLLHQRLCDSLNALLREAGHDTLPRPETTHNTLHSRLFWLDYSYRSANQREHPMGGLSGAIEIDCRSFSTLDWQLWVLGQYLGIGQRRGFGWGRYVLESLDGDTTLPRATQATTLLMRAAQTANLHSAYQLIRDNVRKKPARLLFEADDALLDQTDENALDDDPAERLQHLAQQLHHYSVPALHGVVLRKPGHNPRPLAIPPFFDRVAQRAVAQILTPALDSLMYHGSFGYRVGRSRHSARLMIQQAYQQGYRWVFESDIDDFFDSIAWHHLQIRLLALFGDDPLVDLLLHWMAAPVIYENQLIERNAGLPQGSPLSPLLANLLLDDFDHDLHFAGFKLVRFADDFVVLCQSQAEAQAAQQAATAAIAELGLSLNPEKTQIRILEQGLST